MDWANQWEHGPNLSYAVPPVSPASFTVLSGNIEKLKRKKGDAEKLYAKTLKNLTVDAAKCVKITDIFAGGAAVASMSSETAMLQQQQVEGKDSSSRHVEEQPKMQAFDRESVVQQVSR